MSHDIPHIPQLMQCARLMHMVHTMPFSCGRHSRLGYGKHAVARRMTACSHCCLLLVSPLSFLLMNPVHWLFDKLYPPIRFLYESIQGHAWFDQLTPNIWIGGAPTYARDYDFLVENGITAVLDLRAEREDDVKRLTHEGIDYLRLRVLDVTVPPPEAIDAGVEFIHEHVQKDGVVLVHCAKGRGRSATLVAAYFMAYGEQSYAEANEFMVAKRPLVNLQRRHERALDSWVGQFWARERPEPDSTKVGSA